MKLKIIITIALILLVAGCVAEETIRIGYIGPLTGPAAVLGIDAVEAIEIAVDEINAQGGINGRMVELIVEDDQYLAAKSIVVFNKLVEVDDVDIILMSSYGSVFALAERAEQEGVIIIDPLDCNDAIASVSENVFCVATESESIGEVLAENAEGSVGILYTTIDPFMTVVKNAFVENFDGDIVSQAYEPTENDFRTMLLKMQDVDSLVLLGHDETGIAMRQARELGMTAQFFTTGTVTSPSLQEAAAGAADGTILAFWEAQDSPESLAFEAAFIARVGRPPILDLTAYPAYDSTTILLRKIIPSAVELEGAKRTEAIKDALLAVNGFQEVTGTITIASDGSARIKEHAFLLVNGQAVRID